MSLHFSPTTFSCLDAGGVFFVTRAGTVPLHAQKERGACEVRV